jgi:ABC-type bacteriocin/lantibiotic exporter with double-glycine peptidase domain
MIKKFLFLLSRTERKNLKTLMGMILIMSFFDVLGVASIFPFISVLVNPEIIQTNQILKTAFVICNNIGVNTNEQFLFVLGILVFVVLVISLSFKAITTYFQNKFTLMLEYSIGKRLVEGYLYQPYSWFLNRHSADLGKTILSEVQIIVNTGILPLITLIAQSVVTLSLISMLMIVDPYISLITGSVLTFAYVLIFLVVSGWLKRLGHARAKANQERFSVLSETFAAAKEVKVGGMEQSCVQRFAKPAKIYAKDQATARVIGIIPRFAFEAISFGGMLLLVLYLMNINVNFASILPIITLYAFTGYRMIPAIQQIYAAFTQLRFVGPALDSLYKDLKSLKTYNIQKEIYNPFQFTQAIRLESVSYSYPNTSRPILNEIDISIPAKHKVGFVGATGSGKTTTVDVILGLLDPLKGQLSVDGQIITDINRHQWQRTIGYVPQNIFLADDSVAANIAFGNQTQNISKNNLERAATIANIHEFIVNNLPHGYDTKVGERGVRLSGGQRQRIGIARALYQKPKLLILDEATSALDNLTEKLIMNNINNLDHDITMIMIAHRLSTLINCDKIYLMEDGEIKASGSYDELIKNNDKFALMANKEKIR